MTMETNVTLTGDASRDVCINFTSSGPERDHIRRCFELVVHMNSVVVFDNDDGHYSPVKKQKGPPRMPRGRGREDQCDVGRKCISRRVRELHVPRPCIGLRVAVF